MHCEEPQSEKEYELCQQRNTARASDPNKVRGRELPVGCVSVQDSPYSEGEASIKTYPAKLYQMDAVNKYSIFFIGFLRYEDIHGGRYVTGFCFVYDWIGDKFVRRGDKQYNYTSKEDAA